MGQEPERLEHPRQIVGERRRRHDALARRRMVEGDRARVERESMEAVARAVVPVDRTRAVVHVADDRVADVMEVASDLVEPPRLGLRERAGERRSTGDRARRRKRVTAATRSPSRFGGSA